MKKEPKASEIKAEAIQRKIDEAHRTYNLKFFLMDYFLFRCYIVFKNGKKWHGSGNEHSCTYNQLRYGRYDNIILDREKGYTDLINLIEGKYKGQYTAAKIYSRQPGEKNFNTLCRHYNVKGELEECQDPVIPDEQKILILFYYTHQGRVIVTETDPAGENFRINL